MTSFVVTAVGMTTSLGLDSTDACAAARAGLVRLSEVDTLNAAVEPAMAKEDLEGIPAFVGHMAPVVDLGVPGVAKLLALSRPALAELIGKMARTPNGAGRTGLCVNVSDASFESRFAEAPEGFDEDVPPSYAERWQRTVAAFPDRLRTSCELDIPPEALTVFAGGRVGIVTMLRHGAQLIRSGVVDRCIVGGVDSCFEPISLRAYGSAGISVDDQSRRFLPWRGGSVLSCGARDRDAHAWRHSYRGHGGGER